MNEMTAINVVDLIRACKDSGVANIKLGEIEISFQPLAPRLSAYRDDLIVGELKQELEQAQAVGAHQVITTPPPEEQCMFADIELMIEDPAAWEQAQLETVKS